MNALLEQTRSARIEFGLPWLDEFRVSPAVKAALAEHKPITMSWGAWAEFCMFAVACMAAIMRGDVFAAIRLGVRLFGHPPDETPPDPTSVGFPDIGRAKLVSDRKVIR